MESLAESLSAAEGGAISTTVLYPLEVIKTRIQASQASPASPSEPHEGGVRPQSSSEEISVRKVAEEIYHRGGLGGFFAGVQYAALQSAIEKAVYFYAYSLGRGVCKTLTGTFGPRQNLTVGYISEMVHLPVTVPLEVVITRIITSKGRISSLREAFQEIKASGGLRGLYKGIEAYVVLCLKPALQYTVYEQLRQAILRVLSRRHGIPVKSLTAAQAFFLGALSRALATVLIFPCIRTKKLLMADKHHALKDADAHEPEAVMSGKESIMGTLKKTVEQDGVGALFQGIGPELARGVLSAALMLMLKEKLYTFNKNMLTRHSA